VDAVHNHRLIEHGGSWQGFKSQISRYVDEKLTIVVFANCARANPATLAHGIAAIYNRNSRRVEAGPRIKGKKSLVI
jgi:hypothetical protein